MQSENHKLIIPNDKSRKKDKALSLADQCLLSGMREKKLQLLDSLV